MTSTNIPKETVSLIYGQLNSVGDPQELGIGFTYQNGSQGQIEVPSEPGSRNLRSTLLQYIAEVIENGGKLEWEIKKIVLVESPGTRLSW